MKVFITGTDTGVGKTYVTALLTRALRRAGLGTVALKPICCGSRDDVDILRAAAENTLSADAINPLYFNAATAPLVAAREENRQVDLEALEAWYRPHREAHPSLLVEGAGGWFVPLTATATVADLARRFGLPVLLVVANRLGCLNHTLLSIASIRAKGLECAGLILNTIDPEPNPASLSNRQVLEECCDVPILFDIQPGQTTLEVGLG